MQQAFDRADVFWVHPIQRRFTDVLRKQIRQRHGLYGLDPPAPPPTPMPVITRPINPVARPPPIVPPPCAPLAVRPLDRPLLLTRPMLAKMRATEGWLDEDEADLLIAAAARALAELPEAETVVEVGSYCGKATTLLAMVIQAVRPSARVYAIDPHDGRIGAADKIVCVPPSLAKLKRNLAAAGVASSVEVIQASARDVAWSRSIAFLLIDGMHDYASVRADFRRFEDSLLPGAYIAFHDYAPYFPDVMKFVGELAASQAYRCVQHVGTMVLLVKAPVIAAGTPAVQDP